MITINELLKTLRAAPKPDGRVYLNFCRCVPTTVYSWRGTYAEPALGWQPAGYSGNVKEYPTVASLIAELEKAIDGREYTGWKGGEFSYDGSKTLHIDNPGDYTNTEIVRVEVKAWGEVVIHTATEEEGESMTCTVSAPFLISHGRKRHNFQTDLCRPLAA